MEIYVFTDDILLDGFDNDIDYIVPFEAGGYIGEDDNLLNEKKFLSVFVEPGYVSRKVMEDLRILYNIYSDGDRIFLVSSGEQRDISNTF